MRVNNCRYTAVNIFSLDLVYAGLKLEILRTRDGCGRPGSLGVWSYDVFLGDILYIYKYIH